MASDTLDERFLAYSRLVRPFPVRRLNDKLYQVLSGSGAIANMVEELVRDQPVSPSEWMAALASIGAAVESLADACDEAVPEIERLIEQAPADHRRGLDALVRVIRGLQQEAALEAGEGPGVALTA